MREMRIWLYSTFVRYTTIKFNVCMVIDSKDIDSKAEKGRLTCAGVEDPATNINSKFI